MSRSIIPIGILWVVGFVSSSSYGAGGAIVAEPVSLQQAPSPSVERDASEDIPLLDMVSSALSRVAQVARPSVVSVQTVTEKGTKSEHGAGSGVVFDARGHVITSYHVIDGATELHVVLADGRKFRAKPVGTDPKTDVAVLKIDADRLVPARFGDSSRLEVGHLVLTIGSPFSLAQTVTHGIVSAMGRSDLDIEGVDYQNFIQTDAPTNPGNSGGALVNTHGEVVGINTAIATEGGSSNFSGVAFATPSNVVMWAAKSIISGKPVVRGYLGVALSPLSSEQAEQAGLPTVEGAVIDQVTPDSPASRAGLRPEDIVVQMDDKRIVDRAQFQMMIAEQPPGSKKSVFFWRSGQRFKVEVVLAQKRETP